jgi:DNA-binding CsgD family transcriptional regulator/predicted ATPase
MRLESREADTRRIDSLLDGARAGRSRALLVRGEPGSGKTELLRYAALRASDMTVLDAHGLEIESGLAFCALADVFRPVVDRLDMIPEPQSRALAGALGLRPDARCEGFLVCAATLSLLAAVAEECPVLTVVDDFHRIDAASREALLFAARRLDSQHVTMLMAGPLWTAVIGVSGFDELTLPGHPDDGGIGSLTPQELRLSLIVGRGATNREASTALFISPKTVEAHLHRIYVKLGIRSRTELAHLLARAHMLV